jgi:RHS repeat-associated protein
MIMCSPFSKSRCRLRLARVYRARLKPRMTAKREITLTKKGNMKLLSPPPHLLLAGAFVCCALFLPQPCHAYYHHTDVRDAPARQLLPPAAPNQGRLSPNCQDPETAPSFHGYRYYNASTGRWLSRDPIGEEGGNNLYIFVNNNGINQVDLKGRSIWILVYYTCYRPCRNMIRDQMYAASNWADNNFGIPGKMHANAGSVADMLAHCVGACEVAKGEAVCLSVGIDARGYLQWREFDGWVMINDKSMPKNPDSAIDINNNIQGFAVADSGQDCRSGCFKALSEGMLWTLKDGVIAPYVPPRKAADPPFQLLSRPVTDSN